MSKQNLNKISQLSIIWWIRDGDTTSGGAAKLVLTMLASRTNEEDEWSCYPSVEQIAEDCKISETTVSRALRKLEKADLITTVERPYVSSVYHINVAKLQQQAQQVYAERAKKKAVPRSPYTVPTLAQEEQLNTDEVKITFDDPPPPSEPQAAAEEPSPVATALQSLKFAGEKLSAKDVASLTASLAKIHSDADVLRILGEMSDARLAKCYAAKKTVAGYLYTCITDDLAAAQAPEAEPVTAESPQSEDDQTIESESMEDEDGQAAIFDEDEDDRLREIYMACGAPNNTLQWHICHISDGERVIFYSDFEGDTRKARGRMSQIVASMGRSSDYTVQEPMWNGERWCFAVDRHIAVREPAYA